MSTAIVNRAQAQDDRAIQAIATKPTIPVSDKLLDLVLKKCEDAKKDLEANLNHHIFCVGLLVGLVLGLGASLSVLLLKDRIFEKVLYLIVPLASLYFVTRFGGLAIVFAEARYAHKGLSQEYFREQAVAEHPSTTGGSTNMPLHYEQLFRPIFPRGRCHRSIAL